jgi:hypothetical protein
MHAERYKDDAEHRYIYFFSEREFQKAGAGVAVPEDKDQKEPRPVRVAKGGGWKPSGGGQVLRLPRRKGGFVAGRMVTMVFYDRAPGGGGLVKSNWGMHEFVVPVDQHMTAPPTKYTRVSACAPLSLSLSSVLHIYSLSKHTHIYINVEWSGRAFVFHVRLLLIFFSSTTWPCTGSTSSRAATWRATTGRRRAAAR